MFFNYTYIKIKKLFLILAFQNDRKIYKKIYFKQKKSNLKEAYQI
jgi:hypothetical protein